jgi:PTH2 family peptidyl-tRNA hydrolase
MDGLQKMQQVIVIRKDLTMRKGKIVAQGSHAALSVVMQNLTDNRVTTWLNENQAKICVYVNSEEELLEVYEKAENQNLLCALIKDEGLTEFNNIPTLTCCAIGPATKEELQDITGNLKLL